MTLETGRIVLASLRDGGGTFAPDGIPWCDERCAHCAYPRTLPHAYAVAVASVAQCAETGLYDAVADAVRVASAAGAMAHYVGTWRDGDAHTADATWYVDLVRVIYSRSYAIALGRRYAQLAIYDLTAGEEVRL